VNIQRKVTPAGKIRYRARVKANGREVASRVFDRKSDAVAWEQDQRRQLRAGEWLNPRRGQVPLNVVAEMWLESRRSVKRRTWESDRGAWRNYIAPRFGRRPVASITTADVSSWLGDLMRRGLARSTATRALATLRSLLIICGGGRPSDGECCRGGESSDRGAGATRGQVPGPR
jgi:Phage integrase, N-terminal SAM-like domain